MSNIKEKLKETLYKIRNPEYDEHEREFKQQLQKKRLLFFLPFLIAAALFMLLYLSRQ
ncbi:MAG: hypothetical protein ACM3S4_07560 [Burkholderiales bacterium]